MDRNPVISTALPGTVVDIRVRLCDVCATKKPLVSGLIFGAKFMCQSCYARKVGQPFAKRS